MDYKEWKFNPGTKEFRNRVEEMLSDAREQSSLNTDNADNTQALTGLKEGRIKALEEVIEELRSDE